MQDSKRQCIITKFIMYFDQESHLEKYYGRILNSRVSKLVNKQIYCGQYALFGKMYKF